MDYFGKMGSQTHTGIQTLLVEPCPMTSLSDNGLS